ncbi:MAG: glycosyltransferase family 2 protein [Chloroflexi bacterium]|nr:glycosyltransferase family 2 protein [Chloroflexota bacterium]MCL5950285.1 glycosyltransferase family 2 protein [Chloroflexota bacterium]
MTRPSSISIIVPAFNEQESIGDVLNGLRDWCDRGEVIVVDDASTDRTAEIAKQAGVRVIKHLHNKGYGAALKTGIRAAAGDIIVMMDGDGQHSGTQIQPLLDAFGDNDMVVGARAKGSDAPLVRRPGKWILTKVANYLAETQIPDLNSGLRIFRRDIAMRFLHILPNGFSFTTTLTLAMFKEGYNVAYVPITTRPRVGTSTVNPVPHGLSTIMLIIRIIALFDPLKVFLPASVCLFLIGAAYWIGSVAYHSFETNPVTSIIHIPSGAVILLVSSVIVFMFGILADQVSAIRREQYE